MNGQGGIILFSEICEYMEQYSLHESEVSYTGQYPDMPEFEKPWKGCIQVSQGGGGASSIGKPLQSEGFSKCVAMILKNTKTLESALFHIEDIDMNHKQTRIVDEMMRNFLYSLAMPGSEKDNLLSTLDYISKYDCPQNHGGKMSRQEFQAQMEQLNKEGIMQARFISGTNGRSCVRNRVEDSLFGFLGVHVKDDIIVGTGNYHWSIVHFPIDNRILIDARNQNKVLSYCF